MRLHILPLLLTSLALAAGLVAAPFGQTPKKTPETPQVITGCKTLTPPNAIRLEGSQRIGYIAQLKPDGKTLEAVLDEMREIRYTLAFPGARPEPGRAWVRFAVTGILSGVGRGTFHQFEHPLETTKSARLLLHLPVDGADLRLEIQAFGDPGCGPLKDLPKPVVLELPAATLKKVPARKPLP